MQDKSQVFLSLWSIDTMQRFFLLLVLILALSINAVQATSDGSPVGARRLGMGGAYSGIRGDVWSLWANPAGLTGIKRFEGGLFTERRYMISEMNTASFGGVIPFKQTHLAGISASTFGFGSYRRNEAGLSYATTLYEVIHLGVKFNFINLAIADYGSVTSFFANVGFMADVSKRFTVGFWTQNVNQAKIGSVQEERLSTILNGGVAYRPADKLLVTADVVKYLDYPMGLKGGFEYYFIPQFNIRAGYSTSPSSLNAGLGFKADNISIDFANSYHERLGYTPHLSVTLRLGNEKAAPAPAEIQAPKKEKNPAPKTSNTKPPAPKPAGTQPESEKKTEPAPAPKSTEPLKPAAKPSSSTTPVKKPVLSVTATKKEVKAAKAAAKNNAQDTDSKTPVNQPK